MESDSALRPGGGRPCDAVAELRGGEETQLAEEVHLVEEEVLGLQRVAVGGIERPSTEARRVAPSAGYRRPACEGRHRGCL
jgi:hypothetical protein